MNNSPRPVPKDMTIRILNIQLVIGLVLLLVGLSFHLVIKQSIPGPIGTYWKEGLLGLLVLLWLIRSIIERRLLLTGTSLDGAVLAYLGLLLFRFASDSFGTFAAGTGSTSAQVPLWGLYMSVLYLPLYWLIPTALRTARRPLFLQTSEIQERRPEYRAVRWLLLLLVGIGGLLALGGLAEFILDVPLWPSEEIRQRLGHSDFYIYGSHVRRVYFTLDSPTMLANTLAMLLPLGIALAFVPLPLDPQAARRWKWLRIASGTASLLMAACIVVTFSRGIWVATILSLLVMAFLGGLARSLSTRRHWRAILVTMALVIVAGLAWAILLKVRANTADLPRVDVIELSPEAYAAMPVAEIRQQLLKDTPLYGQAITQTWTLLDPITGAHETKTVLYEHPPEQGKAEITYQVQVPPAAEAGAEVLRPALRFSIALDPRVWSPDKGDGTSFQIYVTDIDNLGALNPLDQGVFAFVRHLNPKHNPSDRRWRNFVLDLSPWAGRTIHLTLITEAGPAGDWGYDWSGWAHLQIVSIEPGLFGDQFDAAQENTITRHVRSILDWTRDETNRDRLAAWSLSLSAWRAAPLWGQGLGTTGAAALRTQPERAFVTESQVLKSLVELGLPGLLALAYLWFQIARTGYRAYRGVTRRGLTGRDRAAYGTVPDARMLLWGILTSLMIVFLEGWVYQNLEGKQVNAYFWVLVGLLGFLAHTQTNLSRKPGSDD